MTTIDGFGSTQFGRTGRNSRVEGVDTFPLSPAQLGMWYAQHVDPEVPINIGQYVDLRGPLDAAVLEHACEIASQEMETGYLRLAEIDGVPHQIVDRSIVDHLTLLDLRDESDPIAAAREWMRDDLARPLDLLTDRLIAGAVIRVGDERWFWYSRVHHIALDGFGAMTYMNRTADVYSALLAGQDIRPGKVWTLHSLYESEIAYRDSGRFAVDREYWAQRVAGMTEATSLTGRSAAPATANGIASAALSDDSAALLDDAVLRLDSSPAGMLIAAFAAYLAQSTANDDVVLSMPVTARTTAIMRNSGGMLSNVVPLRLHVGTDTTVAGLLKSVQAAVAGALRHQRYRHEDIRRDSDASDMQRDLLGPLVNIMLFHNEVTLGPVVGEFHVLSTGTVEDLAVNFYQSVAGTRTHIDFETNPNLYTDDEARTHHARFLGFFDAFLRADPERRVRDIELLTATERELVVESWNATAHPVPAGATLVSLFGEQVARTPEAVALSFGDASLTYAEFDARVNRLARQLVSMGVGPESLVAVAMRRSLDLLVAIYAVQAAGGAYVPVDPDQPAERIGHILDTARPVTVLSADTMDVDLAGYSGAPLTDSDRISPLRSTNTAYVIFTSGSTGRPKGVAVSHRAIVNRLVWMQGEYGLRESDVVLQKTPVTFDVSVWELFWPLQVGARLVIAAPEGHRDPAYLAEVIAEEGVTTAHFVPSMLAVFVAAAEAARARSLTRVFASGEALPAATAAELRSILPPARLHNLYGPTEAAVDVTFHEVTAQDTTSVPIGAPVWNTQVYVLDARLRPVPVGASGELYLAGDQLARGYVARPDLTAERFVANPMDPGSRMYRTGDLVSWNASGELEYIGRTDFQVKLRGLRIELGEIEQALLADEAVAQSVVVVREDAHGGEQLAGYVVPVGGVTVDPDALRAALARILPAYMVPAAVVVLDGFPLNASGKLDRTALPAPTFTSEPSTHRAPRTPAEEIVAGIFADVLDVPRVGLDDSFFDLGGNSLIANQIVARIGAAFNIRLGVRTLFEAPTVEGLTARAEAASSAQGTRIALLARPRPEFVPLSLAQQRMWFLNQYDPAAATYNLPLVVRLSGRTDVAALRAALLDVVARHESLRTVFPEDAAGVHQVVLPMADVDLDVVAEAVSEDALASRLAEFASAGFDVTTDLPIRVGLFDLGVDKLGVDKLGVDKLGVDKFGAGELAVALVVHHIAADGMSWAVLARDVMVAYTARAEGTLPGWSPLRVQYADYSLWQREVLGSEDDPESLSARQIDFWTEQLAGLPDQLDLPADRPRPAVQSFRGGRVAFEIPADVRARVEELARAQGVTTFMVVHAALAVLLSRLSGTADIAIGTPVAGRGEQALDDVVGMFVNTLVLRTEVDRAASFTDLLRQVRERDLAAFGNADVPFERLVQVLAPARSTARHPLFQVVLSFENMATTTLELPDLTVTAAEVDVDVAKFDLQLTLRDQLATDAMEAEFVYATDLFDATSVAVLAERFVRVLDGATAASTAAVGDLDLLDEVERAVLGSGRGAPAETPRTLTDLIEAAVAVDPDHPALVLGDVELAYAELDAQSSRLARHLIARGAGPETTVAVALGRSLESVLAVWAVAKTGAAFVPVDPGYPADRIAHMVTDSGAILGVTVAAHLPALPETTDWVVLDADETAAAVAAYSSTPVRELLRPIRIDNPAYVIYTSGSTGLPKGVVVTHGGLANFTAEQVERYGVTAASRTLHFASPSFDASILELTMAIGAGATMVIAPTSVYGGAELADLLRTARVTHAFVTPAALGSVDPSGLDELRAVVVGGEACPADLVARWAPGRAMFNAYGPTESTVATNITAALRPGEFVTIGGPIRGMQVLVLDERLNPVPAGVAGELYVSGPALARGYRGLTGLTSARFVANPYGEPGSRLYRTGDVVRWVSDGGEIEYVGRSDFQVKVRGFRIELGEIDSALTAHDTVDFAVTVGHRTAAGTTALVSYVRIIGDEQPTTTDLIDFASRTLPAYMVPAAVVVLDEIPLTPAGKVDRKALPEPVFESRPFREPATAAEVAVAGVFADVLGLARVGADDDFFELGGNSLIATQVVARVGAALDATVPVRILFEASTVGALAAWAQQHAGSGRTVALGSIARPDALPLSLAQQRMWFLNRFDADSTVYNIPMAMRLTGSLDLDALTAAVTDVVGRHEVLRTVYPAGAEGPRQVILDPVDVVTGVDRVHCAERELPAHLAALTTRGFDVTAEEPVRGALYQLAPDDHVLALVVHHISADGWSMAPLARDVMVAYTARTAGAAPDWAPLPVQYADYALWQRAVLGDEADPASLVHRQIDYWRTTLAGLPDQLDLPSDRRRPAVASHRGATHAFTVDAALHSALTDLARREGATLFMVLHSALAVLLARLSGTTDIAIGTPVAGRGEQELDDLIGMFVGTLVLRTEIDGAAAFAELLAATRETDLAAFGHVDVPFERLVEVLAPARSTARHPLFQVMLSLQNQGRVAVELPGLQVAQLPFDERVAKFDLQLDVRERFGESGAHEGLDAEFTYATDLFDDATVAGFAERLLRILGQVAHDPTRRTGDLELLAADEREQVLFGWNVTAEAVPEQTLVDLFAAQVARTPQAVALTFEGEALSYAEFDARVNRLARHLIMLGVEPESLVAVAMRRSLDLLVAIYAVQAAGGAYVPVDPDQPAERIGHILDTARPVTVLSADAMDVDLAGYSGAPLTDSERLAPLRPTNTAYVIFTSGSTGRPKGVAVSHRAIVNRLVWMQGEYGLRESDVVLQKTPVTFDVSVWELFWPLQVGARLMIAAPDGHRDPAYLAQVIAEQSVTTAHFVPSMLAVFVAAEQAGQARSLTTVFASGEALPAATAGELRNVLPQTRLHNLYGPTEAAVDVTFHEVTAQDTTSVPIGAPVWNTQVYVLDARLRPVPVGASGELYLAGDQLARGYVARPDLTAERFVANPYVPGARMYRTGDLVSWNGFGELEYLGRTDFQVKLRGLRIELGEIEQALAAQPGVAQSVVVLHRDEHGVERLVGYVMPAAEGAVDPDAVRAALSGTLPAYMVPSAIVVLDTFPLNASGKLDRKALPAPVFEATVYRAPSSPLEVAVAAVFAEVLGHEQIGADDDFFELGGNSLIATQVAARLGAALDTQVPVRVLFEAPTVAALAARVEATAGQGARPALEAQPRPERLPLSLAQSRMWFLNQFDTASAVNNIPAAVRLRGALNRDALQAAVADLVARHEVLRTVYPATPDGPIQVILPAAQSVPAIDVIDVAEAALIEAITTEGVRGFDVTLEVPLRVRLLRISECEHVLMVVVHHIAADGFSVGPLVRDLIVAYGARGAGTAPDWAPLAVQYADYALWQRDILGSESDPDALISTQLRHWSDTLAGLPEQIDLPTDRPRPETASNLGASIAFDIPADLHGALTDLARTRGATLFMVAHASLAVLLARLSGTEDVAIGTPFAGRGEAALDDLVGMFVGTLVLRTGIRPGDDFLTVLDRARATDVAAFANADVPFERLVEVLDPARSRARHPLFQVALTFQNFAPATLALPGLEVSVVDVDAGISKFDLQVTLTERFDGQGVADGIAAELTYATDLFDEDTARSIADRYLRVLDAVVAEPDAPVGDIDLLTADERDRVLARWNSSGRDTGADATLADRLEAAVAAYPDRVAVRFGADALSYGDLDARVNRLARTLVAAGVGPETLVAVTLPRSLDLVVALLAVVKAGGGYLPVDPTYPADRIAYMLADARPVCVVTDSTTAAEVTLPAHLPVVDLDRADLSGHASGPFTDADRLAPLRPANVAYVIYTSGSTGRPKGVQVPHRNVVRLLDNTDASFRFDETDVWTMFHSYAFDFSVWELWGPLLYGGTLVVVDHVTSRSPDQFLELLHRERVTVLNQTPSAFHQLVLADGAAEHATDLALRYIVFGGEALELRRLSAWFDRHPVTPALVNMYGITETTVHVSHRPIDADTAATASASLVGQAIAGLQVYVLDARLRPVPVGVPGEIYVAGVQLARGYLGQPALTAGRFVANPYACEGSALYRSGDLARWSRDGDLEYLGRADDQVKIRGFRIELGEIEAAVLAQPGVGQAAVIVREDVPGNPVLVAYLVPADGTVAVDDVRAGAAGRLAEYMVPSAFVVIDAIPLTANGKLDRRALPAPVLAAREYRAPATAVEEIVAGVFADALGAELVGRDDDFFDLGGNSLVAAQVVARLGVALDTRVPVRALFEASTVAALAVQVEAQRGSGSRPVLTAQDRPERVPLSPAQQRMWFLNRFDAASTAYNIPMAIRLTGDLDVAALEAAVADVFARHESLRTRYPDSVDGPFQEIVPVSEIALDPVVVSGDEVTARVFELVTTTFDVTTEVPVRMLLLRDGGTADEYVLVSVVHHICADGSSMVPFARDVMVAYAARIGGQAPAWTPLPVQYADYAIWQRAVLGSEDDPDSVAAQQIGYWTEQLAGLPDQLSLPTDHPRPAVQSFRGGRVAFAVDAGLHRGLSDLARAHGSTLFMAAHAVFAVLLSRLAGTGDIAVGTPTAGRGETAVDDLIGMFVGTLALRTHIDAGAAFGAVLDSVRDTDLQAFAHADIPFERLVEVLNPTRSTARHPIFQVGLSFQNHARAEVTLPGLTVAPVAVDTAIAQFDLQLFLTDRYDEDGAPAGVDAVFSYASDLFDEATVREFADRFLRIVRAVVADPTVVVGDIDVLGGDERARLVHGWNDTDRATADLTLVDLFDAQVAATPDAPAFWYDGGEVTYAEFDARANRLARTLIDTGVAPEATVALAMRRSLDLVIGMYAVAKAGGAYVPVDPDHPADRIATILDTARPVCVLTTTRDGFEGAGERPVLTVDTLDLSGRSAAPVRDAERVTPLLPQHPAYVIFTSGSTGRPKGVAVPHAAIVNQLLWMRDEFALGTDDALLLKTAATFDLSVWEFWSAAISGSRTVIAPPGAQSDPEVLLALLREQRVTTLHAVPSTVSMLATTAGGEIAPSLRRVLAIGEALPAATARAFTEANAAQLVNLYGPTEAAVSITSHRVGEVDSASVPIGVPEWNSRVYVLDARLRPVPVGVPGELYLAGTQLARGYVDRPDLTADRFVANPFGPAGARMYRTGDLVRWTRTADGSGVLDYVERVDFQVKVRGFRIELGEIEAAFAADPTVAAAAVITAGEGDATRLVAYLVPVEGATIDTAAVSAGVARRLPSYMVPTATVVLDALPLNINGKLDRKALPEHEFAPTAYCEPATAVERSVAAVFAELLSADRVGLGDDFFALGGNSLVATQVVARLGAELDVTVPVLWLFETPTVGALAARLADGAGSGGRRPLVAGQRPDRVPLSPAQQRMWVVNRMVPDSAAYNIPVVLRLSGLLDVPALEAAVVDVVARHEVLRTVYPDGPEGPEQVVLPPADAAPALGRVSATEHSLPGLVTETVSAGFDVTRDLPVRARLFELGVTEHVLVVMVHHISADGFSMGPLTRDVMVAYSARVAGAEPAWAPLAVQYADYSLWQRGILGSEDDPDALVSRQIDYWRGELAGLPEQLELPTDHRRPPRASGRGAAFDFEIDGPTAEKLASIAREHNSTVFMVVHSAFAVLLAKLSGSSDIAIGTPVAGRGERVLDDLVGMFVNTVVLRTAVSSGARFADLLAQARTKDLAALGNADVPFERLVDALGRERSSAYSPLFQVMFAFQNLPTGSLHLPGLEVSLVDDGAAQAKVDLQLSGAEQFDDLGRLVGIRMQFTYATDLFAADTVRLFAGRFARVLEAIADDPEVVLRSIDILTDEERSRVAPAPVLSARDLPDLVAAAAAAEPDRVAVSHQGRNVTFGELGGRIASVTKTMGAALEPAAVVTVSLSGLLPGILPALGAEGHAHLIGSLIDDSRSIVQKAQLDGAP